MLIRFILLILGFTFSITAQAGKADAAALYDRHCAACHGTSGEGGVGVPLALKDFQRQVSNRFLEKTILYGRPGRVMPAFTHLTDAEIKAIVSYIRSFAKVKIPAEDNQTISGNITKGKVLFQQHCSNCHGRNGEGGKGTGVTFSRPRELPVIAPALNNIGFLKSASDRMIKDTLVQGRQGTPMKSYTKQGLSDQDINDITAYIRAFEKSHQDFDVTQYKTEDASIIYDSPYDLKTTVANIKRAVAGKNFRLIRVQSLDHGLVPKDKEDQESIIIYFCNFKLLDKALAIDSRVGLFLPCRITVVKHQGKVKVIAINPKRLSYLFNNNELQKLCTQMSNTYIEIIEEAIL